MRGLQDDRWHSHFGKLVFPNDALTAVRLAFEAVLGRVSCFGEQANDIEELASGVFLIPIGRKADRLTNRELMGRHRTSGIGGAAAMVSKPGKSARLNGNEFHWPVVAAPFTKMPCLCGMHEPADRPRFSLLFLVGVSVLLRGARGTDHWVVACLFRTLDQVLTVSDCLQRGLDEMLGTRPRFSASCDEIAGSGNFPCMHRALRFGNLGGSARVPRDQWERLISQPSAPDGRS